MPVIDRRGQPLPDGRQFKGTRIIFGIKQPGSSAKPSKTPAPSSVETGKYPTTRPTQTTTEDALLEWSNNEPRSDSQLKNKSE